MERKNGEEGGGGRGNEKIGGGGKGMGRKNE